MMDPVSLATGAVLALSPYLPKLAESAAEKIGEGIPAAVGKLYHWAKGKLTAGGQEAMDDLAKAPDDQVAKATLERKLAELVKNDPALAAELAAALEEARSQLPAGVQTQINQVLTVGDNSKAAQVTGNQNSVSIS